MSTQALLVPKIKFLLYRVISPAFMRVLFWPFPRKTNSLLILKPDGIGDYVLFRNYLKLIKFSKRYRHHEIHVLTTYHAKDLAVFLDHDLVTSFFWYSDSYFLQFKLVKLLWNLQRLRPETVFYCNYSRTFSADWIVNNVNAKNKIGVDGDTANQPLASREKSNKRYTQLITVPAQPTHEFKRNKQIFEAFTQTRCALLKPVIEKEKLKIRQHGSIVIFPGGSHRNKKWSTDNYKKLCHRILSNPWERIILAGGKEEITDSEQIRMVDSPGKLTDLTGKQNLVQLCELIAGSKLVISNDTVAIHLAVALDVPVICIAKGDFYGRFLPYPVDSFKDFYSVFPRTLSQTDLVKSYKLSDENIDAVLVEDVYEAVESALYPTN
jgi:ADP-heptose:LPS heptosyltransferase